MERVKGEDRFGEQSEYEGIKKKGQQKKLEALFEN